MNNLLQYNLKYLQDKSSQFEVVAGVPSDTFRKNGRLEQPPGRK